MIRGEFTALDASTSAEERLKPLILSSISKNRKGKIESKKNNIDSSEILEKNKIESPKHKNWFFGKTNNINSWWNPSPSREKKNRERIND